MVYYSLPLFSGSPAYLFLGESVGMVHGVSLALILTGIILANQTS